MLLDALLAKWFRAPTDGIPTPDLAVAEERLGRSLPVALREWYARYGARTDVWSRQDRLLKPCELKVERDVLIFAIENQGVVTWGIRLEDLKSDDPPVFVSDQNGKDWLIESPTTSAFAIQYALMNVKWCGGKHSANGEGTDGAFAAIAESYPRIPVAEMHWPTPPTCFYGNDEIIIETNGDTWIWATAQTQEALAQLDALVRDAGMDDWVLYDGE